MRGREKSGAEAVHVHYRPLIHHVVHAVAVGGVILAHVMIHCIVILMAGHLVVRVIIGMMLMIMRIVIHVIIGQDYRERII